MGDFGWNEYSAMRNATGPAPKEEEMQFENRCRKCDRGFMAIVNNARYCPECAKSRTAERRAVARDAYMAALFQSSPNGWTHEDIVKSATAIALETVRRWDAFMAAVDAEGKAVSDETSQL